MLWIKCLKGHFLLIQVSDEVQIMQLFSPKITRTINFFPSMLAVVVTIILDAFVQYYSAPIAFHHYYSTLVIIALKVPSLHFVTILISSTTIQHPGLISEVATTINWTIP